MSVGVRRSRARQGRKSDVTCLVTEWGLREKSCDRVRVEEGDTHQNEDWERGSARQSEDLKEGALKFEVLTQVLILYNFYFKNYFVLYGLPTIPWIEFIKSAYLIDQIQVLLIIIWICKKIFVICPIYELNRPACKPKSIYSPLVVIRIITTMKLMTKWQWHNCLTEATSGIHDNIYSLFN